LRALPGEHACESPCTSSTGRARLDCIHHLLQQIPYRDVAHDPVVLPSRVRTASYERGNISKDM
jgi:hypothetical protein